MSRGRGFAAVEVLVAGALLLLLLQSSWTMLATQGRAAGDIVRMADALDATRVARHVLAAEIREGAGGDDWALENGELRLRAFRGVAILCPRPEPGVLGASVTGGRRPDPDKDSLLVLDEKGVWTVATFAHRASDPDGCLDQAPFEQERWILEPPVPHGVFARYFERGGYRFSDGSFRYEVSGRWQPILPSLVDPNGSTLALSVPGGVTATMLWDGTVPPASWTWSAWSRPDGAR